MTLILVFFAFSLSSGFTIPYVRDDIDHLHLLAGGIHSGHVFAWLMAPHNEHIAPFFKAIYLFTYKNFGLDPLWFHVIMGMIVVGCLVLVQELIFFLSRSRMAALLGLAIMAGSNLFDQAIFVGTNSHIFLPLFLFLFLFYSLARYSVAPDSLWGGISLGAVLCLPLTFALGLTSVIGVWLFQRFSLSDKGKENLSRIFSALVFVWAIGFLPYLFSFNALIHAPHYHDFGLNSAWQAARFPLSVGLSVWQVVAIVIPRLLGGAVLSWAIFLLCFAVMARGLGKIEWRKVIFIFCFFFVQTLIIFTFRSAWGRFWLTEPRFLVFPVTMAALVYPLILGDFLENKLVGGGRQRQRFFVFCVCLLPFTAASCVTRRVRTSSGSPSP